MYMVQVGGMWAFVYKNLKTGIRPPLSLHHKHPDQVGGSGNEDRHSGREHHLVPCLHEASVRSICPLADGMPDSAIRSWLLPGGNDARAAWGWIVCRWVREVVYPPLGQRFSQTIELRVGVGGGSGLIFLCFHVR